MEDISIKKTVNIFGKLLITEKQLGLGIEHGIAVIFKLKF